MLDEDVLGMSWGPIFVGWVCSRYIPVVTLSRQDNEKLLGQLKSGFKRTMKKHEKKTWKNIKQKHQWKDKVNI